MIYSEYLIKKSIADGDISIYPFRPGNVQPNSYDVILGDYVIVDDPDSGYRKIKLPYVLKPGEFILATTEEYVEINRNCCALLTGKSTLARRGLNHLYAGFVDCGFHGNITLELTNVSRRDILLIPGMPIGQLVFFESPTPEKPYSGHYQGQRGVTPAWDEENIV